MAAQKSKGMLYGLGFLVLGIWGLVVYRLFSAVQGTDDVAVKVAPVPFTARQDLPAAMPDTFRLLTDYPDPFTGEAAIKPDTVKRRPVAAGGAISAAPPAVVMPNPLEQMKYLGFVSGGKDARQSVAIISHNGREKMMRIGDTLAGVRLLDIGLNAVRLKYRKEIRTLKTE